jgi:hypothetical protein
MTAPPSRKATVWAALLALFSVAILCAIAASLYEVWRADHAAAWPTTEGTVVESRPILGCARRGSTYTGYFAIVRYQYRAGGVDHASDRVVFGASTCYAKEAAQSITAQFPPAARIKVYFNPQAPAEAVLVPGRVDESTWTGIVFLFFLLLITASATAMIVVVSRSRGLVRRPYPRPPDTGT